MRAASRATFARQQVAAFWLAFIASQAAGAQPPKIAAPRGLPIRIDSVSIVGADAGLARPIDSEVGPDGAVYVADLGTSSVFKITPDGKVAWQSGRQGEGPGEFRMPYRICVLANGSVLVWDESTQQVSRLDPAGKFVGRQFLDIEFASVDNVVALPGGEIAVTGVAKSPQAYSSAIHIFSDSLRHRRSFGDLPAFVTRYALDSWGAGTTSRSESGTLLYVRRLPYEIVDYRATGAVIRRTAVPIGVGKNADDAIAITRVNGRVVRRLVATPSPGRAIRFPSGHTWGGHSVGRASYWDVVDPSGKLVSSEPVPPGIHHLIGIDWNRKVAWFRGDVDDEPVLIRAKLADVAFPPPR